MALLSVTTVLSSDPGSIHQAVLMAPFPAPANFNALCAVRPTVGLVSQAGVVPITHTKGERREYCTLSCSLANICPSCGPMRPARMFPDTVGPMARSVIDAAHLLQAMVSGGKVQDEYVSGLEANALNGQRLIVPQNLWQWNAHPDGDYVSKWRLEQHPSCFYFLLTPLSVPGRSQESLFRGSP